MKTRRHVSLAVISGLAALSGLIALGLILSSCEGYENVWMTRIIERGKRGEAQRRGDYEDHPADPYAGYRLLGPDDLTLDGNGQITAYNGPVPMGKVRIPATINGQPVNGIANGTSPNAVFQNKGLTGIVIPSSVTYIGTYAFSGNQLTGVTIPDSVTSMGNNYVFGNNQLTNVTIGSGIITIPGYAFSGNQLTSVTIPNNVTTISGGAFYNNQLTSVTIGDSVSTIGAMAFQGNPITSVTIMGNSAYLTPIGWIDNPGNLGTLFTGGAGTYTRPDATSTNWEKQP